MTSTDNEGEMTDYRILDSVELRARYVTLTDRLIATIEGHDGWRPDDLVFLDKSGRPVAWLVKALWRTLARTPGTPYEQGVVPPLPMLRMANIDREQWWGLTGASETGVVDVARVPSTVIGGLRSVFLQRRPDNGVDPFGIPSWLDGRRVLVIDEVSNTGDTLRIARGLVKAAFPTADVRSEHWMTPGAVRERGGLARAAQVPVWYRSDTWEGRLVGNRLDPANPPVSWRSSRGALFQSTRPRVPDLLGRLLKREIQSLAHDVAGGRLLAAPATVREDWLDRVRILYGYDDAAEFTAARMRQQAAR
jgi:hypothetical protein